MTSAMILQTTDLPALIISPKQSSKKRPQLQLQLGFLNLQKIINADEQDKSVSQSAQKQSNIDTFVFKEIHSAELQKNLYDNYHLFKTFYDVSMRKCNRAYMEDRFCAMQQQKSITFQESFFGVFDGHKTTEISNFLKNQFYNAIQSQINYEINIYQSILQAAQNIDQEVCEIIKLRNLTGGSTALCALIRNKTIHIINVGDSIAAMVSKDGIRQINEQHRPDNAKEKESLIKKEAILLDRSGTSRINGELAISRSFGDIEYKQYITAIPDIYSMEISPYDKYLILATDGYWDVINLEETDYLISQWEEAKQMQIANIDHLSSYLISEASQKITNFKKDNITVLVIDLSYICQDNPMIFSKANLD